MLLTAIPVLYIGINLQEKWIYMSAQREAARMAARSNAGPFFNIVEAFIQIVVASIIIYALYKGYKYIKAKEEEYDEKVLKKAIAKVLPNAEFIRDGCIEPEILYKYGIIRGYDSYEKSGMIRYQKDNKDYCVSNIHLLGKREDEHEHVEHYTIYMGQAYTVNYKTGLSGTVRILTTKMMAVVNKGVNVSYPSKRKGETKIETENILFNNNFAVYATSEQSAMFVLSPYVMEQLLEMKRIYDQIGVYISGNHVVITLKTDDILFSEKIYIRQKEAQFLEDSIEEVRKMLKLTELLENSINGNIKNNFNCSEP